MDQIKENPFLSAYVAVLVVGAAILGFLCFKSYGEYQEAKSAYDQVRGSVDGLKGKPLFPDEKNKKARTEEVTAFNEQLLTLEKDASVFQPPRSELTDPAALQQKIRTSIEEVRTAADLAGVEIKDPNQFALGLEGPLAILPREAAVQDLDFQLTAARKLVEVLLNSGITRIDSVSRQELASEAPPVVEDPKAKSRPSRSKTQTAVKVPLVKEGEVINRFPLIVTVGGSMASIQTVLNRVASTEDIFYSIRYLRLENERKIGPDKEGELKNIPDPNDTGPKVSVLLGEEEIKVQLFVDAIRFVSREQAEAAKKEAAAAAKSAKSAGAKREN